MLTATEWIEAWQNSHVDHKWATIRIEEMDAGVCTLEVSSDAAMLTRVRETCNANGARAFAAELDAALLTAKLYEVRHLRSTVPIAPTLAGLVKPGGTIVNVTPADASAYTWDLIEKCEGNPGPWLVANPCKAWIEDNKQEAVNHGMIVPKHECKYDTIGERTGWWWRGTPVDTCAWLSSDEWMMVQCRGGAHGVNHPSSPKPGKEDYSQGQLLWRNPTANGRRYTPEQMMGSESLCGFVTHDGVPIERYREHAIDAPVSRPPDTQPAPPDATHRPPITNPGDKGPRVTAWQEWLLEIADERLPKYGPDSDHGTETESATVGYLDSAGLERDGKGGTRPKTVLVNGIDISYHQPPDRFDWLKVAEDNAFMIARATYGVKPDRAFVQHVNAARGAGLAVGGYAFFRQGQDFEPQFELFDAMLEAAGIVNGDLLPAVDMEANEKYDGPVNAHQHNTEGRALVEAVARKYGAAMIYISPNHWLSLGKPDWVLEHHIWTADWKRGATKPRWPDDWAIWQTTGSGTHLGVRVPELDKNVARRLPRIG